MLSKFTSKTIQIMKYKINLPYFHDQILSVNKRVASKLRLKFKSICAYFYKKAKNIIWGMFEKIDKNICQNKPLT